MSDVFDYLNWRGDLSLLQNPFNEVDSMILARLSYAPFEYINNEETTIKQAANRLLELSDIKEKVLMKGDFRLISDIADSKRFNDMMILSYENLTDLETETQFFAMTIQLKPYLYYISFRGTDNSFVGWKEDFNMSFACPVPAQEMALNYLEKIAHQKEGHFILGGHSKGGNLAVYSAAFCKADVAQRIESIYNFDGPGFNKEILSKEGYKNICNKITTFIPQSSIVGLLLEHEEKYIIVHSNQPINVMQHDVFSWEVQRDSFIYLETVTNSSKLIDNTINSWVSDMNMEQREKFSDTIYIILSQTNLDNFKDLSDNWFFSAKSVIKSLKNLDDETKTAVIETLRSLVKNAKSGMIKAIKNK